MGTSVPGDKSTKEAINQWNLEMRQQPWYQDWFHARGLDANHVKLSKGQREELERLAIANGAPKDAFDDMMIDPAGNLNTEHGFASLPTWAKIAIGAGAVAGGFFAAPAIAGAVGGGAGAGGGSAVGGITATGGGVGGIGAGGAAAGTAGGIGAGTLGTGAAAASGGTGIFSRLAGAAQNPALLDAGGRVLGSMSAASANNRGAETAVALDRDRLQLDADQLKLASEKSSRDAQSDAMNKALWGNYVANYQSPVPADVAPYAGTIQGVSDEAKAAGRTLADQAQATIQSGQYTGVNPQVTPFGQLPTQPGMFEKIAGAAGPALSFWSLYNQMQRGR